MVLLWAFFSPDFCSRETPLTFLILASPRDASFIYYFFDSHYTFYMTENWLYYWFFLSHFGLVRVESSSAETFFLTFFTVCDQYTAAASTAAAFLTFSQYVIYTQQQPFLRFHSPQSFFQNKKKNRRDSNPDRLDAVRAHYLQTTVSPTPLIC